MLGLGLGLGLSLGLGVGLILCLGLCLGLGLGLGLGPVRYWSWSSSRLILGAKEISLGVIASNRPWWENYKMCAKRSILFNLLWSPDLLFRDRQIWDG